MVKRVTRLPSSVYLSKKAFMPNVYDQGDLGSCTANAIAAAYEFETRKQALADFMPSRLAIYYGERVIENTVKSDAGAEIRDGMKVIAKSGVADESLWPYDIRKFAVAPPRAYTTAATDVRLRTLMHDPGLTMDAVAQKCGLSARQLRRLSVR